jgi:cyclic pyranopterin phosphate synthase
MTLVDSFNRTIDYLRISVTDRCNLRCVYCMPEEGAPIAPREELLTSDEIERLAGIAVALGVRKIRLTGGEPLVRPDIEGLVARIGALPVLADLSLTTNGSRLARHAPAFAASGLRRVNISLDTLRPDRFTRIARRGELQDVLDGITAARASGLSPIKLNCVVMRSWNDDETIDFARMTLRDEVHVRFIELMPIHWSQGDSEPSEMERFRSLSAEPGYRAGTNVTLYANADRSTFGIALKERREEDGRGRLDAAQMRRAFVSSAEIQARIEGQFGRLAPAEVLTNGPARTWRIPGAIGTIGFVSQVTNDACLTCNRLRITADGQLRPCLMADGEIDLRSALRSGACDDRIADLFRIAVLHKPKEHRLEDGLAPVSRNMSQLGG